jgi:penicillin-binding protein 1A
MLKLLGTFFLILAIITIGGAAVGYRLLTQDLPSVRELISEKRHEIMSNQNSTKVYANDGQTIILENKRFSIRPVELEQVAPAFTEALVATEDRRFYAHRGVDPMAIFRALARNAKGGGVKEGGSTLTQQLARLLFLSNERTLSRKLKEVIVSIQLEQELSKAEILELYMNYVYYGQGAYGIDAAADIYFHKRPRDLSIPEAAMLAGMPQAPSAYNPLVSPKMAMARRNEVIQNLVEVRALTAEEARGYQAKPLGLKPNLERLSLTDKAPYFNQVVRQQTMDLLGLNEQEFWQSGLKIYTTIDLKADHAAHEAITVKSKEFQRLAPNNQAMLMSMNVDSGAVLAYQGGRNFEKSQYDRIASSPRSPGSLFKVFTYAEAIRQGYSPNDVRVDAPVSFGNWSPHNYDKSYRGPLTLMKALAISNNVVAVKLMNELSPEAVLATAKEMGVEANITPNLTATLGGASLRMTELVRSFGTLAGHGVRVTPFFIRNIVGPEGETLYEYKPVKARVLDQGVADTMTAMLRNVTEHGTARGALFGPAIAGKTGTSDEYRDAWFVGYTGNVVTGVWVGNDDNTPMPKTFTGGTMPAQTWKLFMQTSGFKHRGFNIHPGSGKGKGQESDNVSTNEEQPPTPEASNETTTAPNENAPVLENPETGEAEMENLRTVKTEDGALVDVSKLSPEEAERLLRRQKNRESEEKRQAAPPTSAQPPVRQNDPAPRPAPTKPSGAGNAPANPQPQPAAPSAPTPGNAARPSSNANVQLVNNRVNRPVPAPQTARAVGAAAPIPISERRIVIPNEQPDNSHVARAN